MISTEKLSSTYPFTVVITRPAGTGSALARRVRQLGGRPVMLPGMALHKALDEAAARSSLQAALNDDVLLFTSPAAVRFAASLAPLRTEAEVLAIGQGTARALRRHGVRAPHVPERQDSEGALAEPVLQALRGKRLSMIGAPGGRGLLDRTIAERGARLQRVYVYERVAPRLDHRHVQALRDLPASARVLLSSAEAVHNLQHGLPAESWQRLCGAVAVTSSERLGEIARAAGFSRILPARSALSADLLEAALAGD